MAPSDEFRDDSSIRSKKTDFDWKFAGIAFGAMVIIFGVIIGTLVSKNNSLDTSDSTSTDATTTATTTESPANSVDLGSCETKSMMDFTSNTVVLTLAVTPDISALEIEYAAKTFEKTYGALLENKLEQAQADYCDPYCRRITNVNVDSNSLTAAASARQASPTGCDAELKLTFSVEGTYYGCEDTVFPGLFTVDDGERRQLTETINNNHLRRILAPPKTRKLQEDDEESCPICPDDVESLGLVSPSIDQLTEVMHDFVSVLPAICELKHAELTP